MDDDGGGGGGSSSGDSSRSSSGGGGDVTIAVFRREKTTDVFWSVNTTNSCSNHTEEGEKAFFKSYKF